MQKKLNQFPASRDLGNSRAFPFSHQAASSGETNKYLHFLSNQSEYHYTSDEALFDLAYEYYRLASLPNLNDYNSQRMLMILTFAEIDLTLSNLINAIDAYLIS